MRGESAGDEAGVGEGSRSHGLAGHMRLLAKPKWLKQLQWPVVAEGRLSEWVERMGGAERNIHNYLNKPSFRRGREDGNKRQEAELRNLNYL